MRRNSNEVSPVIDDGLPMLMVSSTSITQKIAGSIAYTIREQGIVKTRTIGAGALNQAVKAIGIARGYLAPEGKDIICTVRFKDLDVEGKELTAIELVVEPRL